MDGVMIDNATVARILTEMAERLSKWWDAAYTNGAE
jgi:hypothetical protein